MGREQGALRPSPLRACWPSVGSFAGSHEAAGVLLGGGATSREVARARALAYWVEGARVFVIRSGGGERVLVIFAEPRRLRSEESFGAIIKAEHGRLVSAPVDRDVLLRSSAEGDLVEARGGALHAHALGPEVDPSEWLDLSAVRDGAARPLGPEPRRAARPIEREATSAREALGAKIPAAAAAASAMQRAIASALSSAGADARTAAHGERGAGDAGAGDAGAEAMPPSRGWLASLYDWLRSWTQAGASSSSASSTAARAAGDAGSALVRDPRPSFLEQLRDWLASMALRTQLSQWVARRQAEYLARMLELFERGDVGEALKWAIPLAGEPGSARPRPAFGVPSPRESLALTRGRGAGTSPVLGVSSSLYALLQERYLRALERLKESGRIDEAAFVLAELLGDAAGAIALLERHQRYAEAARLAEARDLDPALVVRLWILAGNTSRAIALARKHNVFAEAVAQLRRTHADPANALALVWAHSLASAGDFAGAVEAARLIEGTERLVASWIDRAITVGGPTGARMLAIKAGLAPEPWPELRDATRALLTDEASETRDARLAFARALLEQPASAATGALARMALRSTIRDAAVHAERDLAVIDQLEKLAGDGALRADRPVIPKILAAAKLGSRPDPKVIRIPAGDVGSLPVRDLALLPTGRMVLALGEAGLRWLSRDGRVVGAAEAPADALVIADSGARALAVARRGTLHRIARVDLVQPRSQSWWEASLTSFTRTFDGARWLVSEREVAMIIDVLAEDWRAHFRLDREVCLHVERGSEVLAMMCRFGRLRSIWRYQERGMVLRSRSDDPLSDRSLAAVALLTEPWAIASSETGAEIVRLVQPLVRIPLTGAPIALEKVPEGLCTVTLQPDGVEVAVRSTLSARMLLQVFLDGARRACARVNGAHLALGDDRGRVLVIDLRTGERLRDLRVRA